MRTSNRSRERAIFARMFTQRQLGGRVGYWVLWLVGNCWGFSASVTFDKRSRSTPLEHLRGMLAGFWGAPIIRRVGVHDPAGLPASPAPQPHGCPGIYCSFFQSAKVLHTFYLHILYCFEPRVEVTCVRLTCGALRPMMPRAPMHGPRLQHTASRWCRARASEASDRHVGACVHPFVLRHLLMPTRGP
jgi:hypothetical protein